MAHDFEPVLAALKPPVWRVLDSYLPRLDPSEHYRTVREYPERQGKYFRPALVLLSAALHGGKEADALLTAAAMQASEEWLLIHDDFEDGSYLRRGKPALQEMFGPEIAVNAGDSLHVIMWKILGDNLEVLGPDKGLKVWRLMSEMLLATTEGQFLELAWRNADLRTVKEEDYMDLALRKSAIYTASGPLQLGAVVAGSSDVLIKNIRKWGDPWGLAFQIADDLLSLDPPGGDVGKVKMEDIAEGKISLILIHLMRRANRKDSRRIMEIYGLKREERRKRAAEVVMLMRQYGSLDHARGKANELLSRAKKELIHSYPSGQARDRLVEAMEFAVQRSH